MDLQEAKKFYGQGVERRHPWELARFTIIWSLINKYRTDASQGIRVLDFGCGDGFVLRALAARSPASHLAGIDSELDPAARERITKENPRIQLYRSTDEIRDERAFDIVLLCDVIEHIEKDVEILRDLSRRSFIGPQTIFLITVPAFQGVFSSHDKWLGHYRRYTVGTLARTIEQAGLKRLESKYFFTSLLAARALISFLEKIPGYPKAERGLAGWKGGSLLTQLYYGTLMLDYKVGTCLRLPGLSCYALCQRTEN